MDEKKQNESQEMNELRLDGDGEPTELGEQELESVSGGWVWLVGTAIARAASTGISHAANSGEEPAEVIDPGDNPGYG